MTCNTSICTIVFGLLELSKITLFKRFYSGDNLFQSPGKWLFLDLFRDFELNYLKIKIFK